MIQVLIVDDHAVLRSGLRLLIDNEPDMAVVGEASNGASAIECIEEMQPDIVLMDISLPDMVGTEIIQRFKQNESCKCHFLVLTMHCEEEWLRPALNAGAAGYVVKSVADVELLAAIRAVHDGRSYLRAEAVSVLMDDSQALMMPDDILSHRELEVLKLVANGYTSAEIGEHLFLSPKTIDTYRRRIMSKLDLDTRADLVDYALKHGILKY
jgi:two-component system, NarL family, response regulator NreC